MSERRNEFPTVSKFPLVNRIRSDGHKTSNLYIVQVFFLVFTGESHQVVVIVKERIEFVTSERRPYHTFQTVFGCGCTKKVANLAFQLRPKAIVLHHVPIFGTLLFGKPRAHDALVLILDFVLLQYLFQGRKQSLFTFFRFTVHLRLCAHSESGLNIHNVLFNRQSDAVRLHIFCFFRDSGCLACLFIIDLLLLFDRDFNLWVFFRVRDYLMAVRIPVVVQLHRIGKLRLAAFFQIGYLLVYILNS